MITGTTRHRERRSPWLQKNPRTIGKMDRFINGQWVPAIPPTVTANVDNAYLEIESVHDNLHAGPPYQSGGPFASIKVKLHDREPQGVGVYDTGSNLISDSSGNWKYRYTGGFVNPQFQGDPLDAEYGNYDKLLNTNFLLPASGSYGPQVYPRLRPKLEKAGAAVFLAESRDIPRMLKSTAQTFSTVYKGLGGKLSPNTNPGFNPNGLADGFLNYQFGWKPFIGDLIKFNKVVSDSKSYMDRLTRDNNRWHRRKAVLDENTQSTRLFFGNGLRCSPLGNTIEKMCVNGVPPGNWEIWREVTTRVYCVGKFKYYRPEFDPSVQASNPDWARIQGWLTLLGARVNPSNIYKATPWTWLIDWFSNVGDTVDRIQDWGLDGIVSKYMYLMQAQEIKFVLKQWINFHSGPVYMEWSRIVRTKQRTPASSPYGFSLSWDALTPRQLAILAAIGVTRSTPV